MRWLLLACLLWGCSDEAGASVDLDVKAAPLTCDQACMAYGSALCAADCVAFCDAFFYADVTCQAEREAFVQAFGGAAQVQAIVACYTRHPGAEGAGPVLRAVCEVAP